MSYKLVSNYVISYITKNGNNEMLEKWNEKEFKKLFKDKNGKTENSPKKNKSAYVLYSNNERENMKKEGVTLNNKQMISELAKRWNKIKTSEDEDDKKIFEKFTLIAEEEKQRYNSGNGKNKSNVKKNMSSYMYYCKDERENINKQKDLKLDNKQIISEFANRWKVFKSSENKKDKQRMEKYDKMAKEDKERYKTEKENEILSVKETPSEKEVDKMSNVADTQCVEQISEKEIVIEEENKTKKNKPRGKGRK
jgi:hypothetical protein